MRLVLERNQGPRRTFRRGMGRCPDYERGETQTFYNEFFEVFGVKRRRVASFEEPVKKLGEKRGFIDLFWKGVLARRAKERGPDLTRAKQQALDYFPGLKETSFPATFWYRFPDLRALRPRRGTPQSRFHARRAAPQRRTFRLHSRRPEAHVPRPGPGQYRSVRNDGPACTTP